MSNYLEKAHSYKAYYDLRQKIIKEFKLHILDQIPYDLFKIIYDKYGKDIEESDFARIILDVDYIQFQKVKRGDNGVVIILSFEYYIENDFWRIRKTILEKEKTIFDNGLNYEKVQMLHDTYGEKFSLEMFAEHVLGINVNRLEKLRYNPNQRTEVTDISLEQITYIQETRKLIASDSNVFIRQPIKYDRLQELYKKYCPDQIIDERTFAIRVLAIASDNMYRIIHNNHAKETKIFSNFPIEFTQLSLLRRRIIEENEFTFLQELSADIIDSIYAKYGSIYTKPLFLQEIFDINILDYNSAKRRKSSIKILSDIKIEEIQGEIREEEGLERNQLISKDKIEEIYSKYGKGFDKKDFCICILGISNEEYCQINEIENVKIFGVPNEKIEQYIKGNKGKIKSHNTGKKYPQKEDESYSEAIKAALEYYYAGKPEAEKKERKKEVEGRRHAERVKQILDRIKEKKQEIYVAAYNAKRGVFITEEELLGKKETKREYTRKKIIEIGNTVLSLENYMDVEDIINFFYLCNKYHVYDIVIEFIKMSDLESKINSWSEDDKTRFRENMDEYKGFFLQKAWNNAFVGEDEEKFIAAEKKHVEKKIDFLCYLILLSGKPEQQDIQLIHQLCKKYNKYKTEFGFLDTCINNLDSFSNKDNYWDSKKKEWIKGIMKQASKVYARGLIRICIKEYNDLSEENISKISQTTKLRVEEIKELYEEYKKQVDGETVGL